MPTIQQLIRLPGFSSPARAVLPGDQETELLRAELLSLEQLKRHAITLASQYRTDPRPGPDRMLSRLADNERVLLAAYDIVTTAVQAQQRIAPSEEWLLDNFYLIEQQIDLTRRHLPRGYSRQLPRLANGPSAGLPRVYALALELISHQDGRVAADNAAQFVAAYQTVEPLQLGELWAFPIMLRLALLENLRRVGVRIAVRRTERDAAMAWADRMVASAEKKPQQLIQLLAEFARENAEVPLTAPFVEEFFSRLQALGPAMAFVQSWIEHQLHEQGVTATQMWQDASRTEATNQISLANSIGSLRFLGAMDWREFVESHSAVEQTLRADPAGVHASQDFATRDRYRHVIEDIARRSTRREWDVAAAAIALAQSAAAQPGPGGRRFHVGYYLIDRGRVELERAVGFRAHWTVRAADIVQRSRLTFYLAAIVSVTMLAASVLLFAGFTFGVGGWRSVFFAVTAVIGASALAVPLVNRLISFAVPPCLLPRLDFSKAIPAEHRTMVVVPTLLGNPEDVAKLLEALEIRYLGNRDPNLFFALLTDFRDAPARTQPNDDAVLEAARAGIQALNETYRDDRPCIFYLFHRPRVWNPFERLWMGYERKRGKLEQFNALLRGGSAPAPQSSPGGRGECGVRLEPSPHPSPEGRRRVGESSLYGLGEGANEKGDSSDWDIVGERSLLASIRYVITLDTDTQLPRDAARALVGNMAHPLNRPHYDAASGRIVEGHAILQPRVSISLASARESRFAWLFAGEAGIDPYTREVSDVYQDVFGEGSFIGKGIYDVDAFRQAVDGRFPENLILSHDLLEGGYARSALVTDVDLIEEHPASYAIEVSRQHRWMRGDWQIAGWLRARAPGPPGSSGTKTTRQRNPLSALSRWKIFDNLRRTLVPPSLLGLLAGGWLFGASPAWLFTLAILTVVLLPTLLGMAIELADKPRETRWLVHLTLISKAAGRPFGRALLTLALLPYDALICVQAIMASGVRMLFTRRRLLLWHTRAYARRNARRSPGGFYREMWIAPAVAMLLAFALAQMRAAEWAAWAPVLLLWLLAPGIGWWISKPLAPAEADLSADQQMFLRALARRTWRYFAQFVGAHDNWLPPDNFQEFPAPALASRTSPTNIGMTLLANQTAYDLGYISAGEFLRRTAYTFATLEKLERYRGHFYNWYDTRTLQPLQPQYVSSVDSGNLCGCLITLQAGLAEIKTRKVMSASAMEGLADCLHLLAGHALAAASADLERRIGALRSQLRTLNAPSLALTAAMKSLEDLQIDADGLLAALPAGSDAELFYWAQAFADQIRALRADVLTLIPISQQSGAIPTLTELATAKQLTTEGMAPRPAPNSRAAIERLGIIDELIGRCRELAVMDFEFLYDTSTNLLTIGYDVGERRRDPACYDLLASEARLASFLLIAQQQLPQKHWFALGRQLTSHGGETCLISWSGSMFEYLMPQLIMPSYENTLLGQTCKAAVARHIEYGRQRNVPWGISESCYNATDVNHVYQYRAFGVPGLGFKRGLADDLVVAPYASALALTVMPREACRNLQRLTERGFLGAYGMYEAIDYTPSRVRRGKEFAIVRAFMAHHQGMSLLAFAHVLRKAPMQRRFSSDPLVRATELLLQERVPKSGARLHPHAAEAGAATQPAAQEGASMRVFSSADTPIPEVQLLSNTRYHVMATHAGGGYSRWRDLAITRWREDVTADDSGSFIYLRDRDTGAYWSCAYQPTRRRADRYEAIFLQGRAEYRRHDDDIETHTEIGVSPEDDVEIRRVTLTNKSSATRHIEVTSYAEVVLAPLNADLAHRAFSNLFVQTEILAERQAILCTRRPRTPQEQPPWLFHLMVAPGALSDTPSYETDRARFIGRGRSVANPAALAQRTGAASAALSNSAGAVLDPIVAVRRTITLSADESAAVQIITGVAETRAAALVLADKYCDRHFVERALEMAWFHSQEALRHINANEADAQTYARLATSVIHASAWRRAAPGVIARNRHGQSGLWRFAISGDLPIVLVRISARDRIDLVRQALQAHAYWRMKGVASDLVILNEDFSGYRAVLHDEIIGLINAGPAAQVLDRPGGVFVRRGEEFSEEDRVLFQAVARVVLTDSAETFADQVNRRPPPERWPERLIPTRPVPVEAVQPLAARARIFVNGVGGFTPDGREYVIMLEPGEHTPAPWANVIASAHIGTVVSDSGSAYTWVGNAHEFRLSAWYNDPVTDNSAEALYIRDEETGAFWSPTPLPAAGASGYVCRHGFGYSVFEHDEAGIASELFVYVANDAPVKFAVVKLRNHSGRARRLSLTAYWELVMGEWRHTNMMHIVTETDPHSGALFAHNAYGREFADWVLFAQVSAAGDRTLTGNRTEFIGRNGTLARPAAMQRARLSGKTGAGLDPCAAIQAPVELADGQEHEIVFVIGAAPGADEARHYIQRFAGPARARQALESVWEYWNRTLGAVYVETPDPALNVLANGWLVYQTLSCRVLGRSGYYQSGGAYGFRDQLQDTMALMHAAPWLAREQLIRAAERQFRAGDVQHWWHPPGGKGVRTHCSDDYLWLAYATCRYVTATGDTGVLDEPVAFLEGRELTLEEEAYFDQPQRSSEQAPLYEHCVRAIKYGLRFGAHRLPLMGAGDWNDGMNLVGHEGRGESVWLAWFLYENLVGFEKLARDRSDTAFAELCRMQAGQLRENIEAQAWDGEWYRRAWFDDGTPLGSSENSECRIDSISQSWAIISGGGDPARAERAMQAVDRHLVRRDARLIQLFDPPFDKSALEPGYIKGYTPGVRENGGQYTHAAIWVAMAYAMRGDNERAWQLFDMLNPVHHSDTAAKADIYKVEPYVMAADIYATPSHIGRGGWTWYTGSAGWMYRLTVETLLGVNLEADRLRICPCIPDHWQSYKIHYRYRETLYRITVRPDAAGAGIGPGVPVEPDTAERLDGIVHLVDDRRTHDIEVLLAKHGGKVIETA